MGYRDARSDRQPAGCTGPLHQCAVRCVSRQLLSDQKLMMKTQTSRSVQSYAALLLVAVVCVAAVQLAASDPGNGNWPMWGGTPDRNQVSNMKNVPTEWDVKTKKN